ncbi:MAG: hypothetical protein L0Z73_02245 [Gammaproteobacteria bacterium]|nr:hypothetical protein [Gammaproteobacteria bacterium]
MANPEMIETIESLQNSLSNIKVFTVVPMGVLLILYFFSFATAIDRGMYGLLVFEIVTTVLFVFVIIFINRVGFALLKMRYKNMPPFDRVLPFVEYSDLTARPEDIYKTVESRRGRTG